MARDTIFKEENPPTEFSFDTKVAEVFDDMLNRSIPCYQQVIEMSIRLLRRFCCSGDIIYDLGCSTGGTLIEIARKLPLQRVKFRGLDASQAMIDKASLKLELLSSGHDIIFYRQNITEAELSECGAVLINYTLQFLSPDSRMDLIRKVYHSLRPGGILILCEKTTSSHSAIKKSYEDIYLDFKKEQGYSETEIARKRKALENVLVPFTASDNLLLLEKAGFNEIESFFRWFNFAAFLALKEEK